MQPHPLRVVSVGSCAVVALLYCCTLLAQTPAPIRAPKQVPPPGTEIPAADRAELEQGVKRLADEIASLRQSLQNSNFLPDVEIYHKSVAWPLKYNEPLDLKKARTALTTGLERARQLREGQTPWLATGGVRAYQSRIDDSIQPYILYIPASDKPDDGKRYRLDFFCHGRDEKLTELNFILGKAAGSGDVANLERPTDKFVVHPYGRFCNANKFAGEIDVLEVLDAIKKQYPIDDDRVVMTGFSMGGASAWHLAAHYPHLWVAASPGAGFAETARYQKLTGDRLAQIPWYEQTLWRMYDATEYALNLANCPTIAYAGDQDPQRQSGDVMEEAMAKEGLKLERIWGVNTGHKYEPEAKKKLDARLGELAVRGRDKWPTMVRFATHTLRYNQSYWVTIDAMEKHWTEARVEVEVKDGTMHVTTKNVAAFTLTPNAAAPPGSERLINTMSIDGAFVFFRLAGYTFHISKENGQWHFLNQQPKTSPKRHGLQGPIDDAFMDRFLVVTPTGKPLNDKVGAWASAEQDRAIAEWRKVFRGDARVKPDNEITERDLADSNLVLFGDPSSNAVLRDIAGKLPVAWTNDSVRLGDETYPSATHAPVAIYPNPLNPNRYVVVNSGFTFREGSSISNSRQTPRLPDYAVVDVTVPADDKAPGKVVAAGFFGEKWELLPDHGTR